MWYDLFFLKKNFLLYINCISIVLFILFSSEKSVIDMFAEQYGNYQVSKSEFFINLFIFLLIIILFLHSYANLKIQFS
ncbi:hypothetical protein [Candidatus Phytoplasma oryzae]|nr:hypothetical protein PIE28_00135 [Candidatus Phytoplasma oryzae]